MNTTSLPYSTEGDIPTRTKAGKPRGLRAHDVPLAADRCEIAELTRFTDAGSHAFQHDFDNPLHSSRNGCEPSTTLVKLESGWPKAYHLNGGNKVVIIAPRDEAADFQVRVFVQTAVDSAAQAFVGTEARPRVDPFVVIDGPGGRDHRKIITRSDDEYIHAARAVVSHRTEQTTTRRF